MTETPPARSHSTRPQAGTAGNTIMPPGANAGAVVLCGGHSSRMGRPKALLPFGEEILLQRICRIVLAALGSDRAEAVSHQSPGIAPSARGKEAVGIADARLQPTSDSTTTDQRVIVVAARNQDLPSLPESVAVVRDEYESCGPLAGIATGLDALPVSIDHAFITSCDVPLLSPALIRQLFVMFSLPATTRHGTAPGGCDILIPTDGEFDHVLCGIYHRRCPAIARRLLEAGHRRPRQLLEACRSVRIPVESLRHTDPSLDSFRNMNTPADYAMLREEISRLSNESASTAERPADHLRRSLPEPLTDQR